MIDAERAKKLALAYGLNAKEAQFTSGNSGIIINYANKRHIVEFIDTGYIIYTPFVIGEIVQTLPLLDNEAKGLKAYFKNKKQEYLKDIYEKSTVLRMISDFLKENNISHTKYDMHKPNGNLLVSTGYFHMLITCNDGQFIHIKPNVQDIVGRGRKIPIPLSDPSNKALKTLLAILRHYTVPVDSIIGREYDNS